MSVVFDEYVKARENYERIQRRHASKLFAFGDALDAVAKKRVASDTDIKHLEYLEGVVDSLRDQMVEAKALHDTRHNEWLAEMGLKRTGT